MSQHTLQTEAMRSKERDAGIAEGKCHDPGKKPGKDPLSQSQLVVIAQYPTQTKQLLKAVEGGSIQRRGVSTGLCKPFPRFRCQGELYNIEYMVKWCRNGETCQTKRLPKQTTAHFIHFLTSDLAQGREDPLRNRLREKRERVVLLIGWWEIRCERFSPRADESG